MHFGFAIDSSDTDLWNIELVDPHLDLLDTDIPSKHFVCLQDVFKMSWIHVLKKSWRRLQRNNFSSFKTSSRRLQDVLWDVFKTSLKTWRRLQDDIKTSSRCLGRQRTVTLKMCWRRIQDMAWRRLQDVLKTSKCLLGSCYFF